MIFRPDGLIIFSSAYSIIFLNNLPHCQERSRWKKPDGILMTFPPREVSAVAKLLET